MKTLHTEAVSLSYDLAQAWSADNLNTLKTLLKGVDKGEVSFTFGRDFVTIQVRHIEVVTPKFKKV